MGALLSRFLGAGIAGNILNIILNTMRLILSRSLDIEIFNHTQNITLRNPRTYLNCGHCSLPPLPELSPGSSDTCRFPGRYWLWGVAGILVYEAESFTLAIHFCNPINYFKYPRELGLELSPGRAHLGSLEDTYTRMASSPSSASHLGITFNRAVVVDKCSGIVQVSDGPITVRATMSSAANSILRVVLDKQGGSGEEIGRENSC